MQEVVGDLRASAPTEEKLMIRDQKIAEEMKALGPFGLWISEQYGGVGLTMEEEALVMERGWESPGFRSAIGTSVRNGSEGTVMNGTAEQKRTYLPALTRIPSFALAESSPGAGQGALRTTAIRDGEHYVVNGTKRYITNAPDANLFSLMVRTPSLDPSTRGASLFIVDAESPGITLVNVDRKMSQKGAHTCDVIFENFRVLTKIVSSGDDGRGFRTAMKVLHKCSLRVVTLCVGVVQSHAARRRHLRRRALLPRRAPVPYPRQHPQIQQLIMVQNMIHAATA